MTESSVEEAHSIFEEEGFEKILEIPFHSDFFNADEKLFVFFNIKEGILISHDTFLGHINGGSFYYNWKPSWGSHNVTSSGYMREGILIGHHPIRENFRYNLNQLRRNGHFVPIWADPTQFIWLLHFEDVRDPNFNYININRERIKMFPEEVQEAIGVILQ